MGSRALVGRCGGSERHGPPEMILAQGDRAVGIEPTRLGAVQQWGGLRLERVFRSIPDAADCRCAAVSVQRASRASN